MNGLRTPQRHRVKRFLILKKGPLDNKTKIYINYWGGKRSKEHLCSKTFLFLK